MAPVDLSALPPSIYPAGTPRPDSYVTDGVTLYHVERLIADRDRGVTLLELEDCASLDVVLCPAKSATAMGLRPVVPA